MSLIQLSPSNGDLLLINSGSFSTGKVIRTRNELVFYTDQYGNSTGYRWLGSLPHVINGNSPQTDGGISSTSWESYITSNLYDKLKSENITLSGTAHLPTVEVAYGLKKGSLKVWSAGLVSSSSQYWLYTDGTVWGGVGVLGTEPDVPFTQIHLQRDIIKYNYIVQSNGEDTVTIPYDFSSIVIYINGVLQSDIIDSYTITGRMVRFSSVLNQGDNIQVFLDNVPISSVDYVLKSDLSVFPSYDILQSQTGASLIGLSQGGNIQNSIQYICPEQIDGCLLSYSDSVDDTYYVQEAINIAASKSVLVSNISYSPVTVFLNRPYRITKTLIIDGSKVRVRGLSGGSLYFDTTGTYNSNNCITVTGNYQQAAFQGQMSNILENISLYSKSRTLNCIYSVRGDNISSNNGACLHNVSNCTFTGFNKVYTAGAGGWGWNWTGCQFSNCENLLQLDDVDDTYERFTFTGCIWQNSGYAFIINNPDGKVYWHGGSIDYGSGLGIISAGFIEANSHYEWSNRTVPFLQLTSSNASASLSGAMFIRNNPSTQYYIINQSISRQVKIDNLVIISDGVNIGNGLLSNMELRKGSIFSQIQAAKGILYHSSDENMIEGDKLYGQITVTNPTYHSYSINNGILTVTCSGSGQNGFIFIDIPSNSYISYAYKLIASNTSTSSVYLEKFILNGNKETIRVDTSYGTTQWISGSNLVSGGTVTTIDLPKSSSYIRLAFNLSSMNSGGTFVISSLKTFTY